MSPFALALVLMIDLASQNFKDFRPILQEYKEAAEKRRITIPQEFARRETIAREVTYSKLLLRSFANILL